MTNMHLAVLFLVVVGLAHVELKKFTRCELARELVRQGLHRVGPLDDWVCLIENESGRNTKAMNTNSNKSKDWGLYQINDKYWCTSGKPGKDCNVKCEDLLLDDITKATKCATVIYKRHKFSAWVAWKNRCQKNLPNIAKECNINLG